MSMKRAGRLPLVATVSAQTLDAIQDKLLDLFRHLTPPALAGHADYVLWIQSAILGIFPDVRPTKPMMMTRKPSPRFTWSSGATAVPTRNGIAKPWRYSCAACARLSPRRS